jgi:hypothetical protein
LRFTPFFPAHRCVEVSGFQIDKLTNTSKGNFKPSKFKGEVRPFLEPLRQAAGEVFAAIHRFPPLTLSPLNYLLGWERTILVLEQEILSSKLSLNQQNFKFSTITRKG